MKDEQKIQETQGAAPIQYRTVLYSAVVAAVVSVLAISVYHRYVLPQENYARVGVVNITGLHEKLYNDVLASSVKKGEVDQVLQNRSIAMIEAVDQEIDALAREKNMMILPASAVLSATHLYDATEELLGRANNVVGKTGE